MIRKSGNRFSEKIMLKQKASAGCRSNHRVSLSGRSGEIEYAGFAVFRAEGKKTAVRAPGERTDRRVARLPDQNLGAILDAGEEHHAVAVADGDDRILRVTGDDLDAMLRRRQHARLFAHRSVFALERPKDELWRARSGEPVTVGRPAHRSHPRGIAGHAHVLAVGEPPAMKHWLLHRRDQKPA